MVFSFMIVSKSLSEKAGRPSRTGFQPVAPPVWRGAGSPGTDRPEALSYFSDRLSAGTMRLDPGGTANLAVLGGNLPPSSGTGRTASEPRMRVRRPKAVSPLRSATAVQGDGATSHAPESAEQGCLHPPVGLAGTTAPTRPPALLPSAWLRQNSGHDTPSTIHTRMNQQNVIPLSHKITAPSVAGEKSGARGHPKAFPSARFPAGAGVR